MEENLSEKDLQLIEEAKNAIKKAKSKFSTVGSAIITKSGKIYSGVNMSIESSESTSICSETASISKMLSEGEKQIELIVAVSSKSDSVLPPCGACRHIISQFGNPYVIIKNNKKIKLNEIYPYPVI
jgi:cytidine deaminase